HASHARARTHTHAHTHTHTQTHISNRNTNAKASDRCTPHKHTHTHTHTHADEVAGEIFLLPLTHPEDLPQGAPGAVGSLLRRAGKCCFDIATWFTELYYKGG